MFSQRNRIENGGTFLRIGIQQVCKNRFGLGFQIKIFSLRNRIWIRMQKTREGIACPLFSLRGSLTVEAALILPLFLLASLTMLSFIDVMKMTIERQMQQQEFLRQGAVYATLLGTTTQGREGDYIKLDYVQTIALPIGEFGYDKVRVRHRSVVHIFNGYDDSCGDNVGWQQIYVYVTKYGSVYHKKRSCSALNVNIRSVSGKSIDKARNADGKKYKLCGSCGKGYKKSELTGATLYITDYGVKYHVRMNCSDLTRTVQIIKIEDAGGRRACKKCG